MLAATHGRHEADSEASSTYELEVQNSPDEEAHQVAKVLGLPARFDPTIKPLNTSVINRNRSRTRSPGPTALSSANTSPEAHRTLRGSASNAGDSDSDDDDDEAGFDVVSGETALDQQQKLEQLHKMEVGEAAALKMRVDEDSDDDDEQNKAS